MLNQASGQRTGEKKNYDRTVTGRRANSDRPFAGSSVGEVDLVFERSTRDAQSQLRHSSSGGGGDATSKKVNSDRSDS